MNSEVTTSQLWSASGLSMHVIKFPGDKHGPLMMYTKCRAGHDCILFCERKPDQEEQYPIRYEIFRSKNRDAPRKWPDNVKFDQKVGELDLRVDEVGRYVVDFDNLRPEQVPMPSPMPPPISSTHTFDYMAS